MAEKKSKIKINVATPGRGRTCAAAALRRAFVCHTRAGRACPAPTAQSLLEEGAKAYVYQTDPRCHGRRYGQPLRRTRNRSTPSGPVRRGHPRLQPVRCPSRRASRPSSLSSSTRSKQAFKEAVGARAVARPGSRSATPTSSWRSCPTGFTVPEGRVKPWGTAHAILVGRGGHRRRAVCGHQRRRLLRPAGLQAHLRLPEHPRRRGSLRLGHGRLPAGQHGQRQRQCQPRRLRDRREPQPRQRDRAHLHRALRRRHPLQRGRRQELGRPARPTVLSR